MILLMAVFFRFWDLGEMPPGLYPDEAMNGNNALEALYNTNSALGWKFFYPENNGREGLFINLQAISLAIFGNKPWALRGVSGIFGVLTVLGTYFLTIQLFGLKSPQSQKSQPKTGRPKGEKFKNLQKNEIVALIASFFLATSFWHINFSRIGFRAIMAPAFLTWSLFFLLFSFRKMDFYEEKNKSGNLEQKFISKFKKLKYKILNIKCNKWQRKFGNFAGIAGILYGLGFHSYIAYRATPILILLVFVYFWFKQKEDRTKILFNGFLFFFSFLLAASPLFLYFYQNPQDFLGRTSQISVFSSENPIKDLSLNILKTLGMFWYRGDYNWRHNFSGEPQLFWPAGILFAMGILIFFRRIANFKFLILNFKSSFNSLILKSQITNHKSQTNSKLQIQNPKQTPSVFGYLNFGNWKLEFGILKSRNILLELLLLTWFIIGLLPVVISNEGLPHALRAIIVLPPVMIISALALEVIVSKINYWTARQKEKFPELNRKITRIQKEAVVLLFLFFIGLTVQPYLLYFMRYKISPHISGAFSENYVKLGEYLNSLPKEEEKYVVVNASGADVRGIPMPSQTTMFITKTFLPEWQKEKNLRYVLPQNLDQISCENSCVITMLETDNGLRQKIKERISGLNTITKGNIIVLKK